MEKSFRRLTRSVGILFIFGSVLIIVFGSWLALRNIAPHVVLSANILLYVITMLNLYFQWRNINHPNPNVIVRGVIAGTFIKLLLLASSVMIYLLASGPSRSVNAVFVGMGLYIVYTWLEVRISLQMKRKV